MLLNFNYIVVPVLSHARWWTGHDSDQQLHNLLVRFSTFSDLWQVKSEKANNFTNKITVNVSNLTQLKMTRHVY